MSLSLTARAQMWQKKTWPKFNCFTLHNNNKRFIEIYSRKLALWFLNKTVWNIHVNFLSVFTLLFNSKWVLDKYYMQLALILIPLESRLYLEELASLCVLVWGNIIPHSNDCSWKVSD